MQPLSKIRPFFLTSVLLIVSFGCSVDEPQSNLDFATLGLGEPCSNSRFCSHIIVQNRLVNLVCTISDSTCQPMGSVGTSCSRQGTCNAGLECQRMSRESSVPWARVGVNMCAAPGQRVGVWSP